MKPTDRRCFHWSLSLLLATLAPQLLNAPLATTPVGVELTTVIT